MIGGATVVFKSKDQLTVALSSVIALRTCSQEVLWVRAMLKDLGHGQLEATLV